jgi:hypothetical protein
MFFSADTPSGATPEGAARSRLVTINWAILLDEGGNPRSLSAGTELTFNLFSDVTYTGVVQDFQREGDGSTWTGVLQGVENSYFYIVYTADVLIGHFASPAGVYEVSNVGEDLYEIIQVDQGDLEGGEPPTP